MDLGRLELLIKDKIELLKNSKILVIGLGGVGSYAVEVLTRCGVGTLKIVDFDIIDKTNLNRQLMTNEKNIGLKKIDVMYDRIKSINSKCNVIKIDKKLKEFDIETLVTDVDAVIDAVDDIKVKKQIIRVCHNKKINLISSMGMGNKLDPTKIQILEISKTSYDPLSKIIRKMVKEERIKGKVMVVASSEKPIKTNSNVVGSICYVPAISGMLCASFIINKIIGDVREK